jgi:hypothetical protein
MNKQYEKRDNEGVMFQNDKRTEDWHPHFRGEVSIAGVDYWVSETEATSKKGVPYRKLKFKAKQEAGRQAVREARQIVQTVRFADDNLEDVPF